MIWEEKVEMLNNHISPIEDKEINDFLKNKILNFKATTKKTKKQWKMST